MTVNINQSKLDDAFSVRLMSSDRKAMGVACIISIITRIGDTPTCVHTHPHTHTHTHTHTYIYIYTYTHTKTHTYYKYTIAKN